MVSIGAHVYGGTTNSASVIGKYGNPYYDYIAAFGLSLPNDGLQLIPVTGNPAISAPVPRGYGDQPLRSAAMKDSFLGVKQPFGYQRGFSQTGFQHTTQDGTSRRRIGGATRELTDAEEGWFGDILRTAATVGGAILPVVGGPIGALAGTALNAAAKLAESTEAEGMIDDPTSQEGSMERAILAEATLRTMQSMELHPELEESIFTDMKSYVVKAWPAVRKAAPHVMGAMMEPALAMALKSLHQYNQTGGAEGAYEDNPQPLRLNYQYTHAIDQPGDRNTEAFLKGVQAGMSYSHNIFTLHLAALRL